MTTQILIALFAFAIGMWCGYKIGRAINADDYWVEGYFAKMRFDRERRDAKGRFKPKNI